MHPTHPHEPAIPQFRKDAKRRDWGLQNVVSMDHNRPTQVVPNDQRMRAVRARIASFILNAVYPQQLTMPRQYATTAEGVRLYKILVDREVDKVAGGGVRVVVQENARQTRFVMSPLFVSESDALGWARQHMGVQL